MDPITHALVGAGLAGLSGGEMSITNPIVIASVLGAIAPDADIVFQLRGDMAYLKRHRGFSHSLPGLALFGGAIALGLGFFFPEASLGQLFIWAFIGALSHSILDTLNSYGAEILGPFSRKKYTLNLLMITDPILLILFLGIFILPGNVQLKALGAVGIFSCYLFLRLALRMRVEKYLRQEFANRKLKRIAVMPSMMGLWIWDFVLETDRKRWIGQINSFDFSTRIRRKLNKPSENRILEAALACKLGELFKEFTPHYHLDFNIKDDKYVVDFLDLRYLIKKDFLHTGTAVLDNHLQVVEAIFHPYSKRRRIDLGA